MKKKQGFTLVEILIAIFILGIGLLGILTLYPVGVRATQDTLAHNRAALLSHTAIDTLSALDAGSAILTWQLNHTVDPLKDGPWYYPHDDEVFVPDEPPTGTPSPPYSFIVGDSDTDWDGPKVMDSHDSPLFSYNVVVRKSSSPSSSTRTYNLKIVGAVSSDGLTIEPYSPSLPKLDLGVGDDVGMKVEAARISSYTDNRIDLDSLIVGAGTTRRLTVSGKVHVQAAFGSDKTIVSADTANDWYWPDELEVGDYLKAPDDDWYRVASINRSSQTLLLCRPYRGSSATGVALIRAVPSGAYSAQVAVFRKRDIAPGINDGALEKSASECLVKVEYTDDDEYQTSTVKKLRLRPGDHIALKENAGDPDYQHGFWYEIAQVRVDNPGTGKVTVEIVLRQRPTEDAGQYPFAVTRSVVGLYKTSLGWD